MAPYSLSAAQSPQRTVDKTMSCISESLHLHIPGAASVSRPPEQTDSRKDNLLVTCLGQVFIKTCLGQVFIKNFLKCVCVGGVPVYQIQNSGWDLDMIQKDLSWSCCPCRFAPPAAFPSKQLLIKKKHTHTLFYSRWPGNNYFRTEILYIKVNARPLCLSSPLAVPTYLILPRPWDCFQKSFCRLSTDSEVIREDRRRGNRDRQKSDK